MSVTSSGSISKQNAIGSTSNHIKLGIIGTTNVGKSSLFNAFVKNPSKFAPIDHCLFCTIDPYVGVFTPSDPRINFIASVYNPKRTIPLRMTVTDTAGLVEGSFREGKGEGVSSLESVRHADVLLHVLREFDDENVSCYEGAVDPIRDLEIVNQELLVFDLHTIESELTNIENIKQRGMGGAHLQYQFDTLCKAWEVIAGSPRPIRPKIFKKTATFKRLKLPPRCEGCSLRFASWDYAERQILAEYNLLTAKKMLYLLNVSSRDYLRNGASSTFDSLCTAVEQLGGESAAEVKRISTKFEDAYGDIERAGELDVYHAANPHHFSAIHSIVEESLRLHALIRFYTANELEVKCFLGKRGKMIVEVANLIDVFIARNFIRGDVVAFSDFQRFNGDKVKIMIEGKLKHETRKYMVNDGDIIEFHFHGKKYET